MTKHSSIVRGVLDKYDLLNLALAKYFAAQE